MNTLDFNDIIIFSVMFGVVGVISWLLSRQIRYAKARAQRYQSALRKERDNLEAKVKDRTKELEAAQLDKLQQAHRFTELGYFSTAMLHDLANHLSSISLDVTQLEGKKKSEAINRIKENISHIENIIQLTRDHIRGEKQVVTFDINYEIAWLSKALRRNSQQHGVTIEFVPPQPNVPVHFTGNVVGFRQLISNLIVNGVDAYAHSRKQDKRVVVRIQTTSADIKITVSDTGKGISKEQRKHIFEPFYSTKTSGMGMGLFIAKQLVEIDFRGEITIESAHGKGTTFIISLPRSEKAFKNAASHS